MEIYGTIICRSEVMAISETFKAQKFELDASYMNNQTGQMYENILEFQVTGKQIDTLASIQDKTRVKITYSIRGKKIEKKDGTGTFILQNLNAYKIEPIIPNPTTEGAANIYNK